MMGEPVGMVLAAGAVRLVYRVVWWRLEASRENARGRSIERLMRAGGPGSTVVDRRADGCVLTVWTQGPSKGVQRETSGR